MSDKCLPSASDRVYVVLARIGAFMKPDVVFAKKTQAEAYARAHGMDERGTSKARVVEALFVEDNSIPVTKDDGCGS